MAAIDDLVARVGDPALRDALEDQVRRLTNRKDFGLVFQDHRPEMVETPGVRARMGDLVRPRAGGDVLIVHQTTKESLHVAAPGIQSPAKLIQVPRNNYVVVKDFGEPIFAGLRPVSSINAAGRAPTHVVIEGENYHALEALLYTHQEKVDVIFIDPPYNTGSDDWLYNDRYVDSNDAYRHSKWLAFMRRRLQHAMRLLKPSGVIFVSIDDNEQAHLRLLMDDVFGADNFVETIVVEMSTTSGMKVAHALRGSLVKNAEFVHVYRRSEAFDQLKHTPLYDGVDGWDYKYSSWLSDDGRVGSLTTELLTDEQIRADAESHELLYRGALPVKNVERLLRVSEAAEAFVDANLNRIARLDRLPAALADTNPPDGEFVRINHRNREYLVTRDSAGKIKQAFPLSLNYRMSDDHVPRFGRTVIRGDLWKGFHRDMARVDQEGGVGFANGKKPVRLIKQLIKWANPGPEAVILDFFGGSGTTTHAVISMNADDGGSRQSILVTNNELSKAKADRLRAAGNLPGDDAWEAAGVFHSVTLPRISSVAKATNIEFFKLTYEDPDLVALGRRFTAIAPILWMKAGARGPQVSQIDGAGWALPEGATYGVLFDVAHAATFLAAAELAAARLKHLFIVTDSETAFQAVAKLAPTGVPTSMLFGDYLRTFRINGKD